MEDQYIEGNRRSKLLLFGLIGLGALLIIISDQLVNLIVPKNTGLSNQDICNSLLITLKRTLGIHIFSIFLFGALAIYCSRLALRVKRSGQWPPPDMKVPFRTKIKHGLYAKASWIALIVLSTWFFVKPAIGIYTWSVSEKAVTKICPDKFSTSRPARRLSELSIK